MTPSARQLCLLLLYLVLVPAVAAFITKSLLLTEGGFLVQDALATLVSGSLQGHNLLLVMDDHSQSLLDVGRVESPILLATQDSLLHTAHPSHHTQGSLLTVILLFHNDPTAFLLLLADNKHWNPSYLVLFCLDPHLNTNTVLSQPVIQRSRFIMLLQPAVQASHTRLLVYTSRPVHHDKLGQSVIKTPMGVWSPGKFSSLQALFPPRFDDFGGQVLKVPMLCYDVPFIYLDKDGSCVGANSDAAQIIANKLNFQMVYIQMEEKAWGSKQNGTWDGMFGELMYKGKDLVINTQDVTADTISDFDWTYPYWETSYGIILEVPQPLPQWRNILYPFSLLTWGLVFVTTVVISSALAFLVHKLHYVSDPIGIALQVAAVLLGQSMDDRKVRMWWVRVWLLSWWLVVDILAVVYTGNLVSILTIPAYPSRIQTAYDLAKSHYIPSMLNDGGFVFEALKSSGNPTLAALGKKLFLDVHIDLSDPYGFLLEQVHKGTHAVITTYDYLSFTQHKKKITRSTYIMDDKLYKGYFSWFLRRNTPYTTILSDQLTRLVETGILAKIYETHKGSLIGEESQVRGDGVLNLGHLQGAFIVLALGLFAASLTLMLEHLV